MDVTFSPVAGASLRPDGANDDGSGATDPSFDLFLDFNQAVVPNVEPVEPRKERSLSDREALKRVTGREDSETARYHREDDAERPHRNIESKPTKHEDSGQVNVARDDVGDQSTQDDSHSAESSTRDGTGAEQRNDDSEQSRDEDSLAGAQNESGASENVKELDTDKRISLQQLTDTTEVVDTDVDTQVAEKLADSELVDQSSQDETIKDLSDGRFQLDPAVAQSVQSNQSNQSDDELADLNLEKNQKVSQSRFDGAHKTTPQTQAQDELVTVDPNVVKSTVGDVDVLESRFSDDALRQTSSSGSQSQEAKASPNGVQDLAEGEMNHAEWSRLLNQDTPTEKLVRATGTRTGDSVQLSSAGTKASGDSGVGRGVATGPGSINQPAKTSAAAATKQAQAPSQAQLPEGVDEMSILRQISDGLRLKNGKIQRAEIRLNPQELGTVRINMEMKGDAVRLVVSAEHAAVGEMLSNGLEQLRKELLAQGMHIEHVEVRSELPGEGGQKDDSDREQGEGLEREANEAPVTTTGRRHRGQISVRA